MTVSTLLYASFTGPIAPSAGDDDVSAAGDAGAAAPVAAAAAAAGHEDAPVSAEAAEGVADEFRAALRARLQTGAGVEAGVPPLLTNAMYVDVSASTFDVGTI